MKTIFIDEIYQNDENRLGRIEKNNIIYFVKMQVLCKSFVVFCFIKVCSMALVRCRRRRIIPDIQQKGLLQNFEFCSSPFLWCIFQQGPYKEIRRSTVMIKTKPSCWNGIPCG